MISPLVCTLVKWTPWVAWLRKGLETQFCYFWALYMSSTHILTAWADSIYVVILRLGYCNTISRTQIWNEFCEAWPCHSQVSHNWQFSFRKILSLGTLKFAPQMMFIWIILSLNCSKFSSNLSTKRLCSLKLFIITWKGKVAEVDGLKNRPSDLIG